MFDGKRYVTNGVNKELPIYMQNLLWYLVEAMEVSEKDYLQIFELKERVIDGRTMQLIVHKQEKSLYRKENEIPIKNVIASNVYVVDKEAYSTMLLAEEY